MKYHEFNTVDYFRTAANSKEHFWHSINLWNKRPNLINKRLIGCEVLLQFQLNDITLIDEISNIFQQRFLHEVPVLTLDNVRNYVLDNCLNISLECNPDENSVVFVIKRFLLKSENRQSNIEIAILDYKNEQATFFNNLSGDVSTSVNAKRYCYRIIFKKQHLEHSTESKYNDGDYIVLALSQESKNVVGCDSYVLNDDVEWLKNRLIPKIVKWCDQAISTDDNSGLNSGSLKLVNINEYCVLYQKLKDTYGKAFVKIWPENTDPLKFVYEDVAIATYLLLLWRNKKQNFVDLGCGNGLLVHILTSEGHTGLGIDVRARKIWDLFPEGTANLQVKTIAPTSDTSCLYPDTDWLIGNHSDELTPWIPVLSSMSSYTCNFFLLPCCSYELNGQKYQRQNSSKSQYMDYMDYVADLSAFCGFDVEIDKLRIPSTKRVCLIGVNRNYSCDKHSEKVLEVRNLIESKCCVAVDSLPQNSAYGNFKPRSSEIRVRNCTQLDKSFVNELVSTIADKLLNRSLSVDGRDVNESVRWNEGVPIALGELARLLPNGYMKKLKKECGGLQTLIKNHHYIFKIDKGCVRFRKPLNINSDNGMKRSFKTRHCWFYNNHPDKCPLANDECPYRHS